MDGSSDDASADLLSVPGHNAFWFAWSVFHPGANAVEFALAALASCLTGTLAYYGAALGIELEEVSAELEGFMDMRGMLGVDESTRNGLQQIRVDYRIKSPEPRERILELLGVAQKFSPIYDLMTNPVPVSLSLVQ